jgi:NADH-quinone oxidoreductase subunit C
MSGEGTGAGRENVPAKGDGEPQPADGVVRDEAAAGQTRKTSHVAQEAAPTTSEMQAAVAADSETDLPEVATTRSPGSSDVATPGGQPEVIRVRRGMFGVQDSGDTSGYGGLVRPVVFGVPAQRPLAGWWENVATDLAAALEDDGSSFDAAIEKVVAEHGELTLHVRREALPAVAQAMRDEPGLRFEVCSGVSGVHYPNDTGRELHAVYHLLSITHGGRRVRLEVSCPDDDPRIPSVVNVWPGNDWHERETWDMFGIVFEGHPALTRILMPDDWPGHPQRKDYPLGGIPVEYKGAQIPPPDERRSYN